MPQIQHLIRAEIDPGKPVQEICEIIAAVTSYQPANESEILSGIRSAIDKRLNQLKGAESTNGKEISTIKRSS